MLIAKSQDEIIEVAFVKGKGNTISAFGHDQNGKPVEYGFGITIDQFKDAVAEACEKQTGLIDLTPQNIARIKSKVAVL